MQSSDLGPTEALNLLRVTCCGKYIIQNLVLAVFRGLFSPGPAPQLKQELKILRDDPRTLKFKLISSVISLEALALSDGACL